ncbi:MAG: hypothetical protein K2X93_06455 [Candidatus Obscuribacterales bacterium]|nr:hypothetical protein [Candidatus Obscuribacterales bacterium]
MDRRVVRIKATEIGKITCDEDLNRAASQEEACLDCGTKFIRYGIERIYPVFGLFGKPSTRCHNCRVLRRTKYGGKQGDSLNAVVCASCYQLTYVSFRPNGREPIYCADCFQTKSTHLGICAG